MSESSPDANPPATPAPALGPLARWGTLPITLFVQAAASAALLAPTVAAPRLLQALNLSPAAIGVYVALCYLAATVSSQFSAMLLRRWGPIRTSQASLACGALGSALLAQPHVGLAALGALIIGIGYGPVTPASSEMLARTTPARHYALVFSLKQTGVPLGGAIAGLMVPPLLEASGVLFTQLMVALLCMLGLLMSQPLRRELDNRRDPAAAPPRLSAALQPMLLVMRDPLLRRLALCSLAFASVQVCLSAYVVSFLSGEIGWTLVAAGAAASLTQGGAVVGRVLWGWLADRWIGAMNMLLMLTAMMALGSLSMALLGVASPRVLVLGLLLFFGACAIGWNGVYLAHVARLAPPGQAGAATAGCLFFTYGGVVMGPMIFGQVSLWTGSMAHAFAFLVLPLAVAAALLLRERGLSRAGAAARRSP